MTEIDLGAAQVPEIDYHKAPFRIVDAYRMSIIDAAGIPLKSDRDRIEVTKDIDFGYGLNPFKNSPSRQQEGVEEPKLVSNLERKRMVRNFQDVLNIVGDLRQRYLRLKYGDDASNHQLSFEEGLDLSLALDSLPMYLVRRAKNPFEVVGAIPVELSMTHHLGEGSRAAFGIFINKGKPEQGSKLNPDEVNQVIEESGHLVGNKTICGATPLQIYIAVDSIINGPESYNGESVLDEYIEASEIKNVIEFGRAVAACDIALDALKDNDKKASIAYKLQSSIPNNNSQIVHSLSEAFQLSEQLLDELNFHQLFANVALGKGLEYEERTSQEDLFRDFKLGLPRITKAYGISGLGQPQVEKVNENQAPRMSRKKRRKQQFGNS
ncbi:MAG TPA: hypothetical protein VG965_02935 [Patescibacteria group bacterium]|nr:hypothetical protein [Patescibacteria group bacterium]